MRHPLTVLRTATALVTLSAAAVLVSSQAAAEVTAGVSARVDDGLDLRYSSGVDRSGSSSLDTASVSGGIYVFVPDVPGVTRVTFLLDGDSTPRPGNSRAVEKAAPWDFMGSRLVDGTQVPRVLDTARLHEGPHVLDAVLETTTGAVTVRSHFTVTREAMPPVPVSYEVELLYSASPQRLEPRRLDGSRLDEPAYVFARPTGTVAVSRVEFSLDNVPVQVERTAPFDLFGGPGPGALDPSALESGVHVVTAKATFGDGTVASVTARFTIRLDDTEPTAEISTRGREFLLDGSPFDMWGIRTASASQNQDLTDHLIGQLDEYAAHGVNAVTVFYQGSRVAHSDPFSPDGRTLDTAHHDRMEQIIKAADSRGMVVIVGLFYQHAKLRLGDAEAVREAVRTATRALRPYRNVIINIANEQNSTGWRDTKRVYDFRDPAEIVALQSIVHEEDPERLVGSGGYDDRRNIAIGLAEDTDVLLFDTSGPEDSAELYDDFVAAGVDDKPVVNVEMFGGYTKGFPRGQFPEGLRREYLREVESAAERPGLTVFFHNSPWLQEKPVRYDLGGSGTPEEPGIRWYFERVRSVTRR